MLARGKPEAGSRKLKAEFKRALGPFDATMVVIGGIIGAGIFITPHIVAERLDTPMLVLGAWVMGGAIALAGAFSYAELGGLFPKAGGQYVYLRDGLHPLAGFLYERSHSYSTPLLIHTVFFVVGALLALLLGSKAVHKVSGAPAHG